MNIESLKTPETEHLFTPDKVAQHEACEKMPQTRFIVSLNPNSSHWHIGRRKESRYAKSGLIARVTYVAQCNGQQLGGPYGYAQKDELFHADLKCPRCFDQ